MNKRTAAVGLGTAALAGVGLAKVRGALKGLPAETGTFANGMDYARWGDGGKTLVWIPGGPGSDVPGGAMAATFGSQLQGFVDAGYTVWLVTRKRHMPVGHSVEDMAADYAGLIADQFGGSVDTVLGLSYGGMIVLYLAANHPDRATHFVAALAAGTITPWGRDVDQRWASARARGNTTEAGRILAEYVFPEPAQARLRILLGIPLGIMLRSASSAEKMPADDLRVEVEAEMAYDARPALPRIKVPVLLIAAEQDMFFIREIVDETVALIPDCTLVRYPGMGHIRAAMSGQLVPDVLEYVGG